MEKVLHLDPLVRVAVSIPAKQNLSKHQQHPIIQKERFLQFSLDDSNWPKKFFSLKMFKLTRADFEFTDVVATDCSMYLALLLQLGRKCTLFALTWRLEPGLAHYSGLNELWLEWNNPSFKLVVVIADVSSLLMVDRTFRLPSRVER